MGGFFWEGSGFWEDSEDSGFLYCFGGNSGRVLAQFWESFGEGAGFWDGSGPKLTWFC